jgi:putative phage-type endonuclease
MIQGSKEWHEFRRNHIGASDVSAILGVSPWKTIEQLWEEKVNGINSQKDNPWMKRGRDLEVIARHKYQALTGNFVIPEVLEHPEYKFMSASFDGISPWRSFAVEIKIPGHIDHETALEGDVPPKYYPQLQHQMFVADLKEIDYFSWNEDSHALIKVPRDQEYIVKMIEAEIAFWEAVQSRTPISNKSVNYWQSSSPVEPHIIEELQHAINMRMQWEYAEKVLKERILSHKVEFKTDIISVSKCTRKGSVDYDKIPELSDVDLEPYRKPSTEIWSVKIKNG